MFVHYDDLKKTNIARKLLSSSKNKYSMHFNFHVFEYEGKKESDGKKAKPKSKKAVDIKLVCINKIDSTELNEIPEPVLLAKDLEASQEIDEDLLASFFNS